MASFPTLGTFVQGLFAEFHMCHMPHTVQEKSWPLLSGTCRMVGNNDTRYQTKKSMKERNILVKESEMTIKVSL